MAFVSPFQESDRANSQSVGSLGRAARGTKDRCGSVRVRAQHRACACTPGISNGSLEDRRRTHSISQAGAKAGNRISLFCVHPPRSDTSLGIGADVTVFVDPSHLAQGADGRALMLIPLSCACALALKTQLSTASHVLAPATALRSTPRLRPQQ